MQQRSVVLLIISALLVCSQIVFAQDFEPNRLISNSEDWRDVYSIMQYGALTQIPTNFLVSSRHATLLTNQIPKGEELQVFSAEDVPFVIGYESLLKGKGYTAEESQFDNVNLELAQLLTDVTNFIIVDDSYGYNAISVAPYAAISNSFVLFADRDNINEIEDFLESKQVDSLLIYGQVDREVLSTLNSFNPEIINKEGDRFQNNVEIVKKYREQNAAKQIILTNGEFIEQEIMTGTQPVIFIGTNNVPDAIRNYIQSTDIEVGVLIGNELVGTATFIRRQLGISVFVKFAQGARAPQGSISQVEALDMFYLPTYTVNIVIESVKYNRATNQLEVTLKNTEEQAAYFIGTYSLTASDDSRQTVGDEEAVFLDGNEIKTMVYDVGVLPEGEINADIFVIFGESAGALEREIRTSLTVDTVRVFDSCEMSIEEVSLQPKRGIFYVTVENAGEVDCYVDIELVDVVIAGQKTTVGLESVASLKAGKSKTVKIEIEDFEEEDVEDNERIKVRALYGERENSLIKLLEGTFEITLKKGDVVFYSLLLIIVVLIVLIGWKRYKKKQEKK